MYIWSLCQSYLCITQWVLTRLLLRNLESNLWESAAFQYCFSPYLQAKVLWTEFFMVLYTLKTEQDFSLFIHGHLASPRRIFLSCLLWNNVEFNRRFLYLVTGSWIHTWTEKKQRDVTVISLSRTNAYLDQILKICVSQGESFL